VTLITTIKEEHSQTIFNLKEENRAYIEEISIKNEMELK